MNKYLAGFGLCALASATTGASAETLDLTYGGLVGGGVAVNVTHSGGSLNTAAGLFQWNGGTAHSFCVELTQYVGTGTTSYDCTTLEAASTDLATAIGAVDDTELAYIAELFEKHSAAALAFTSPGNTTDLTEAAAFQFALWEIVYEGTGAWNVGSGDTFMEQFTTGGNGGLVGAAVTMANEWLGGLTGTVSDAWLQRVVLLTNGNRQDQVLLVPLPAPFAFGALGVLGVMIGRRRFR